MCAAKDAMNAKEGQVKSISKENQASFANIVIKKAPKN